MTEVPSSMVALGTVAMILALLVVMLLVPWIMGSGPADRDRPVRTGDSVRPSSPSWFSSERERRLWLWTVVVLVAIYSTLSPAQELAAALRDRNLLEVTSFAVLLLVGVVISAYWVRTRPGPRESGAAVGVMAVYLTTLIRMPVPEARSHLFEYGLAALLIYHALMERRDNARRVPLPAFLAVAVTALLGWLDEGLQALTPDRVYDPLDVGLNAAWGLMAVTASLFMQWARSWDVSRRRPR